MKLADLKLNLDNPRTIKPEKLEKLANSIKDFPKMMIKRPIVYDENKIIIGGNMRYRAIQSLGMKEIPDEWTSDASDFTPEERHRFIMQDNAEMGEHDYDMVANQYELEDLEAWGIDVPYATTEEVEEDEAPEVSSEPPVSQLGSIYQLGRHKIMCGSATDEEDTNNLMGEQRIDLFLTDPPYNVDYTGKTKDALKIDNDKMDDGEFLAFLSDANRRADEHMKSGASFYIFHADSEGYNFRGSVKEVGWMLKQCLVWVKNSMVMGRQDYQWKHEPILYGWKSGASHSWYTDRKQTTVLDFERPNRNADHPTMKPIAMIAYLIKNSTKAGDLVYDCFSGSGSGSTLVACEQTDRTCYGMELDPKYVDVIRKRYAKFTNNNELPDGWEELTPQISEKSAS